MLDSLRRFGRTWLGKVVGAFLIVGLAGFGISNVLLDFGSSNVAVVGEDDITIRQFQRAYNRDINAFAQRVGRVPSGDEAMSLGIPSSTLNQLAAEAVVNRLAIDMGVGVSDDRLSQLLREDPTFAGTLGGFQPENFARILQQLGYTEAEYFDLQARTARRQQIAAAMFADAPAPGAAEELLSRFSGDTRSLEYFVLNAQSIPPVAEPTEEEMAAYLVEHQQSFRTEETRTARILVLTLETLAATQQISDEAIAAEYERTRASRVTPERRTIVQAPLTADALAAFQAGAAEGRGFDEVVAETGIEVTDLGALSRDQVTDPALAQAAFGLTEAGDFAIIPGIGGQRVVAVTAIEAGGETPLEEASEGIERALELEAARNAYNEILDQVEELRAAFQPIDEIAERFALPLHQVTLTASGNALQTIPSISTGNRSRIAGSIFDAQEDRLTPTIAISANNNVFFDLQGIEPARDQTLDEVRDQVAAIMIEERTDAALSEAADAIIARLEAGEAFDDVALSLNQFATPSPQITRSGDGTPVINQAVAAAAYSGGPGHFGSAINADGDHVIFHVTEISPAADEASAEITAYVEDTTRQGLVSEFITGLRDLAGVRVNQQTLNELLASDQLGL